MRHRSSISGRGTPQPPDRTPHRFALLLPGGETLLAAACMRNYLILRDKVHAFRADPEVKAALAAARVGELAEPTLAAGETWRDVAGFTPDIGALAARHGVRAAGPARAGAPVRGALAVTRTAAAAE
jgi:hypothetical protein